MATSLAPDFHQNERIAIFIDGSNLHAAARALKLEVDFRRIRQYFADRGHLVRAFYYTALIEDQENSPLRPLIDWLDYNGFTIVTKPAKEFYDETGNRRIKGNMDIELAVDMMELADHLDHVVLFSGDGDFCRVVDAVKRKGVRVTVCSSAQTSPAMVADDLRRQADSFIELANMREEFERVNGRDDDN
ncbi:MAG: NYN domain-containing protein [Alphaproteobacteria bacterium]|nr:MAG: NYN domain-containing protein [Alphaproteobacteria bacterium]